MGRSPHLSWKRSLLLSTFAVSLLAVGSLAADTTSATAVVATETTTAASTSTAATTSTAAASTEAAATTATSASSTSASTASTSTTSATDASTDATIATSTGTASSDMPTLSSSSSTSTPSYAAPIVPSTANSPFMRYSNAPDGTVFIAVGSILGAFALAVLIWRAAVAYMLHRSIARAAREQHAANDKAAFLTPRTHHNRDETPYSGSGGRSRDIRGGSSPSGGGSSGRHRHRSDGGNYGGRDNGSPPPGRGVRRSNRAHVPSTPSASNLFYSPTAPGAPGAAGAAVAVGATGNRDSRLLPAGFYAAGAAAAASSSSPGNSPAFGPRTSGIGQNMSGSSINLSTLSQPPARQVPSAFLDDLLDDNSIMLPPGRSSMHQRSFSHSSQGR